jgi:hypothetical protein
MPYVARFPRPTPRSRETAEGADACGARGGRDGRKMATATIALVSESLAARGRPSARRSESSAGTGCGGDPGCAAARPGPRTDFTVVPGTRGGGGAGARGCGHGWGSTAASGSRTPVSGSWAGWAGRGAALLDPRGAVLSAETGRQLSRRPVALGCPGACSRPARLRPVLGTRKGRTR